MAGRSLERLDKLLVERGLASSRSEAGELIKRGRVRVLGFAREKPAAMFDPDAAIEVDRDERRWVSRGARKLLKAVELWNVDPKGLDCADIGASTGGFTQVLLEYGASRVASVDVGYGQLAWELRNDPRVKVMERTNARLVSPGDIGWLSAIITVDASFISLRTLIPNIMRLLSPGGVIIALVKPQFEVGRERVGKGVVRDPALHAEVLGTLFGYFHDECGLSLAGVTFSPIRGPEGNIEFIFLLTTNTNAILDRDCFDFAAIVGEAHSELR
ncbi:MAG: TlyA family RNA methyltransferase [Synergistaceae bacterium]|jgi:23S rRNA (cytidine1920-2'-O)/16S rRNA (cytidine1409-2'-O)-methyltransferase|nr:TlyA family RNA methyltransferase [Synergistaceae bacterium]